MHSLCRNLEKVVSVGQSLILKSLTISTGGVRISETVMCTQNTTLRSYVYLTHCALADFSNMDRLDMSICHFRGLGLFCHLSNRNQNQSRLIKNIMLTSQSVHFSLPFQLRADLKLSNSCYCSRLLFFHRANCHSLMAKKP